MEQAQHAAHPAQRDGVVGGAYQYMSSDGYRSFSYLQRNTYYLKYVQPIGKNTLSPSSATSTTSSSTTPEPSRRRRSTPLAATSAWMTTRSTRTTTTIPTTTSRSRPTSSTSASSRSSGTASAVNDKAYTYAYNNDSHENSLDPVAGAAVRNTRARPTRAPPTSTDSGNTLPNTGEASRGHGRQRPRRPHQGQCLPGHRRLRDLTHGEGTSLEEQVGVWGEYEVADRYAYLLDYSPAYLAANPGDAYTFGAFDPANSKGSTYKPGYQWYMHVYNKTFQPYIDLIWKPIPNLTIEAGVKDSNFTIDLEAPDNQGTEQPDFTNNTYTKLEPHLSANYAITPSWSAYVQLAEGIAYPIVTDEENVPQDPKDREPGRPTTRAT